MITQTRIIKLYWRLNPSVFQVLNQEAMGEYTRRLGSAINCVNKLCSLTEEMKVLLPVVLGVSPDNSSVNWQDKVSKYWHNFSLEVQQTGMTFDISYSFNVNDTNDIKRAAAIKTVLDKLGIKDTATTTEKEKALVAHLFSTDKEGNPKVSEEELYRYGTPNNIPDYLSWRYCLLTSQVANKPEDVLKSNKIRFYLHSESDAKKAKTDAQKRSNDAIKVYVDLMSKADSATMIDAICVSQKLISWLDFTESKKDSNGDREGAVLTFMQDKPLEFLAVMKDKSLPVKAKLQSYIYSGLLTELPSSSIIVDATNPSIVLGDNMSDAISYISSENNKAYASELEAKYKSLI